MREKNSTKEEKIFMDVEAIIFDKDGTLMDFDAFWVAVSRKAIEDILREVKREDIPIHLILSALGINDGVADVDGVLCKGTYEQMGQSVYDILREYKCDIACDEVKRKVVTAYNRNSVAGEVKPICPNLIDILSKLRNQSRKLAVATTDNKENTHKCLKKLGIEELFDRIYTDDGQTSLKPNPHCVYEFCRNYGIKRDRVLMIGDTMTDVEFAKNAGIAFVGVGKVQKNRNVIAPYADAVIPDISYLFGILR